MRNETEKATPIPLNTEQTLFSILQGIGKLSTQNDELKKLLADLPELKTLAEMLKNKLSER